MLPININMLLQTVFFDLTNTIEPKTFIDILMKSITKQNARQSKDVIQKNWEMHSQNLRNSSPTAKNGSPQRNNNNQKRRAS